MKARGAGGGRQRLWSAKGGWLLVADCWGLLLVAGLVLALVWGAAGAGCGHDRAYAGLGAFLQGIPRAGPRKTNRAC